jgi:hypothetical protein
VADAPAPAAHAKNPLELLKQKVGPLPLGVWLIAAGGIWWYLQRRQSASASASAVPNQQTDPAGNIGSIDPATGYVYGTPEDTAALAANNAGTSSPTTGAASGATSGAQTYADNNTWGIAAEDYLVGLGMPGTDANNAIQNYLTSQPLTSTQQGMVNLAIQAIGPPPSLPGPVQSTTTTGTGDTSGTGTTTSGTGTGGTGGTGSTGGTTTGGSTSSTVPVVTNGHVVSVSGSRAVVGWSATGATTFKVQITGPGAINGKISTVNAMQATYGGLEAGHNYEVSVQPIVKGKPAGTPGVIHFMTTK